MGTDFVRGERLEIGHSGWKLLCLLCTYCGHTMLPESRHLTVR